MNHQQLQQEIEYLIEDMDRRTKRALYVNSCMIAFNVIIAAVFLAALIMKLLFY